MPRLLAPEPHRPAARPARRDAVRRDSRPAPALRLRGVVTAKSLRWSTERVEVALRSPHAQRIEVCLGEETRLVELPSGKTVRVALVRPVR